MNKKLRIALRYFFGIIVVGILIGLIVNYATWFTTKEKHEVTFKLDGWITIGSVKNSDLSNLNLLLDSQKVDNIMKVSWRIINTGNKGIEKFESEPKISIPEDMKIYLARISDKSNNLKVCNNIIVTNNTARIDSLGVFNPDDYIKLDFYLINLKEQDITNKSFENWQLQCKSVDLKIENDILTEQETQAKKEKAGERSILFDLSNVLLYISLAISLYFSYYFIKEQKDKKKLVEIIDEIIKKRENKLVELEKQQMEIEKSLLNKKK